jgi:hypothetical protein
MMSHRQEQARARKRFWNNRSKAQEHAMKSSFAIAAAAALATISFSPLQAAPIPVQSELYQEGFTHEVKGKGHKFGHRAHRNRGLHKGWRIGRHNPHR